MKYQQNEKVQKALEDAGMIRPGEPWFFIRAQDVFAEAAITQYANILNNSGAEDQAEQIHKEVIPRFVRWQVNNTEKVKVPD